jgi:hypothetical protein
VRLIVPTAAAGAGDILARLMGQWLSERLGQPFIIENRPGGGSNIGTEAVVRAPADGYTLLLAGTPNTVNVTKVEVCVLRCQYEKNFPECNGPRYLLEQRLVCRFTVVFYGCAPRQTSRIPSLIAHGAGRLASEGSASRAMTASTGRANP